MNFLGIDTTGKQALIVAQINGKKYYDEVINEKHSEALLKHIDDILLKAKVELKDIDVFGNVSGPGSFTGIRIGLSTIKAFAYALNKKVVNVTRFDVLSSLVHGYVVLECTKSSVYYAKIADDVVDYGVSDLIDLHKVIPTSATVNILAEEHFVLPDAYKKVVTIQNYKESVLPYMLYKLGRNESFTSNEISPFYIQVSQAERNLKEIK